MTVLLAPNWRAVRDSPESINSASLVDRGVCQDDRMGIDADSSWSAQGYAFGGAEGVTGHDTSPPIGSIEVFSKRGAPGRRVASRVGRNHLVSADSVSMGYHDRPNDGCSSPDEYSTSQGGNLSTSALSSKIPTQGGILQQRAPVADDDAVSNHDTDWVRQLNGAFENGERRQIAGEEE